MQKLYAVGETILDIIFRNDEPQTAKPGGSAFNSSITLGRLGAPITFISEMGNDRVGDLIQRFMEENGVGTKHIKRYAEGQSAIALAFLNDQSNAEYQFYKDYPYQRLDVPFPRFEANDLLLFGSFYALNPGIRPRVKSLLDNAENAGATIIYDPNFRSTHLADRNELLSVIRENMGYATVTRASDEDLFNIFEVDNPDDAWTRVRPHCPVLIYTASAGKVHLRSDRIKLSLTVEPIRPLSTIGAGDTFNAGIMYAIFRHRYTRERVLDLDESSWEEILEVAIAYAREVCLSYENYIPLAFADKERKNFRSWKKEDWEDRD